MHTEVGTRFTTEICVEEIRRRKTDKKELITGFHPFRRIDNDNDSDVFVHRTNVACSMDSTPMICGLVT